MLARQSQANKPLGQLPRHHHKRGFHIGQMSYNSLQRGRPYLNRQQDIQTDLRLFPMLQGSIASVGAPLLTKSQKISAVVAVLVFFHRFGRLHGPYYPLHKCRRTESKNRFCIA